MPSSRGSSRPRDRAQVSYISCIRQTGSLSQVPPGKMLETRVLSLGQEDPLDEGMATHSSTLAWRIPWTDKPDGFLRRISTLQSIGLQRVGHTETTSQAHNGILAFQ